MSEIVAAFFAGGIAGFATTWIALRRLHSDNVTAERQKWRKSLRKLAIEIGSRQCSDDLWIRLKTRLNPYALLDKELVAIAKKHRGKQMGKQDVERAIDVIAEILKHDWERAKIESSLRPWGASRRAHHIVDNLKHDSSPQP